MQRMTIDSAAIRFTDAILGYSDRSIEQTLEAFATDVGLRHISYLRFVSHSDTRLLDTIVTYSMQWQQRYFKKRYALIDPVISWGSKAVVPFDWDELVTDDPVILDFFADAKIHDVGRNGISFPVRNRMGAFSLVSFTSDHSKGEWIEYSKSNISKFQLVSTLIDSAASF